jgi:hypothetical protein
MAICGAAGRLVQILALHAPTAGGSFARVQCLSGHTAAVTAVCWASCDRYLKHCINMCHYSTLLYVCETLQCTSIPHCGYVEDARCPLVSAVACSIGWAGVAVTVYHPDAASWTG